MVKPLLKIPKLSLSSYALIAILVAAALLRFNHIHQPFVDYINWRQASTAMMAENFHRRNGNIFYPEISWNGPEPSYNGREFQTVTYIAALLYHFVGQQDWVGRSISVSFSLLGIFALYQLVRCIWGEQHALAAAATMAVIPGSIFFDRSFIPDPAMVALVTTSIWLLLMYLKTNQLRYLVLASLIGTWGFLTKITGLIVGIPLLYAILRFTSTRKTHRFEQLFHIIVSAILTLTTVTIYYLWARHLAQTYPPYHFAGGGNWVWDDGLVEWIKRRYFLPNLIWVFETWLWTKPVIFLVALGFFLPPPKVSKGNSNITIISYFFHIWLLAGVLYYLIGAKELVSNSWNFHILNPAAAALAGRSTLTLATLAYRMFHLPGLFISLTLVLLVVLGTGHQGLKTVYYPPPPWNATQSYSMGLALRQLSQPDDLVVTIANDIGSPIAIYYSQRRGWVFPPAFSNLNWTELPKDESESIHLWEELRLKGANWFGVVAEQQDLWKDYPTFAAHIDHACELKQETSEWRICQILPPDEVAQIPN